MLFNSPTFVVFFAVVVGAYRTLRPWEARKNLLLVATTALDFVLGAHRRGHRARGGKVVFVRFPMSGELKSHEDKLTPRQGPWDRIIRESGAQGIYFTDYPELSGFECPEWSHLSGPDSVEFTRRLIPHLKVALEK